MKCFVLLRLLFSIPFGLLFFLTGRPCFLLCSSVLCQHRPWASHRENALMCPHCAAAPPCPDWWIAGGAGGATWEWMGDESERGSEGAPAHRALPVRLLHLQLLPLTAGWTPVSATITRSLWPPSLSLSLSIYFLSLSLHILLLLPAPFCPPFNICVMRERAADDRWVFPPVQDYTQSEANGTQRN